jgi:hypothetical protein
MKIILLILSLSLSLSSFSVAEANSKEWESSKQYWIDDASVIAWSKEKVFPIKKGDYIVAQATYALRYCNGELTPYMNISNTTIVTGETETKTFDNVRYICTYNGKPIKLVEMIYSPTNP